MMQQTQTPMEMLQQLAEHSSRLEGECEAMRTLLFALIQSHPDHKTLLTSWERLSAIGIANAQLFANEGAWQKLKADEELHNYKLFGETIRAQARDD